jgi:hypothetical protein
MRTLPAEIVGLIAAAAATGAGLVLVSALLMWQLLGGVL